MNTNDALQEYDAHVRHVAPGLQEDQDDFPLPALRDTSLRDTTNVIRSRSLHPAQRYTRTIPALDMPLRVSIAPNPDDVIGSATEVDTPSVHGMPTNRLAISPSWLGERPAMNPQPMGSPQNLPDRFLRTPAKDRSLLESEDSRNVNEYRDVTLRPDCGVELGVEKSSCTTLANRSDMLPDWRNILRSCTRRLDVLESLSFSHLPVEEIQDKFDLVEGRLLDLEHWRQDFESRDIHEYDDSISHDHSTAGRAFSQASKNTTYDPILGADVDRKLSDVEQRLGALEAAFPSYANPWTLEVVLLPYGGELRGIWGETLRPPITYSKTYSQSSDGWNGVDSPVERNPKLSCYDDECFAMESIENSIDPMKPRLCPKAPGPKSMVYKRLYSRGLVRQVTITSCGAHDIWNSIEQAFSHFRTSQRPCASSAHQQPGAQACAFVPLRKVHKSSQLRFLQPHELVGPVTWDISFLNSGVIMKATGSVKRLYITTPDAYVQSTVGAWTWPRLKKMPNIEGLRTQSEGSPNDEKKTGTDADESCWSYHPKVDPPQSLDSSPSPLAEQSTKAQQHGRIRSDSRSLSGSRSLPSKASIQKRYKTSSENSYEGQKRRRVLASPMPEIDGTTPRWSHEPSSMAGTETRQLDSLVTRRKGQTPFAYATPHSDNAARTYLNAVDGGDTERDSEDSGLGDDENEWRGVEDEASGYGSSPGAERSSSDFDPERYGDDEDDGLTIYEV